LIRLFVNGKPLTARSVVGGVAQRNEAWLNDVKVGMLLNNIPLTIGSTAPNLEPASAIVDEFCLFNRALTEQDAEKLFIEVIGPHTSTELPQDGPDIQAGPEITTLSQNGLQSGQANTLTITGEGLGTSPAIVLPIANVSQAIVGSPQPNQVQVS